QIARHGVDAFGEIAPGTGDAAHFRLPAEFAFRADFARHAGYLGCEGAELIDHRVDGVLQLQSLAAGFVRDFGRELALGDGCGDAPTRRSFDRQIARHGVDAFGEIAPRTGDAAHFRLPAELAFRADFAGHAGYLGCEGAELIDHRVDGV